MNEITDISDLRPAPRVSSPPVLWAMVSVMLVTLGMLLASPGGAPPASLSAAASQADFRSTLPAVLRGPSELAAVEPARRVIQAAPAPVLTHR